MKVVKSWTELDTLELEGNESNSVWPRRFVGDSSLASNRDDVYLARRFVDATFRESAGVGFSNQESSRSLVTNEPSFLEAANESLVTIVYEQHFRHFKMWKIKTTCKTFEDPGISLLA